MHVVNIVPIPLVPLWDNRWLANQPYVLGYRDIQAHT
jgi:hypothetical protein